MTKYFTHYWKNETWLHESQSLEPLSHLGSNQFKSRSVGRGDCIYPITVLGGRLYVLGRLDVDQVIPRRDALRHIRKEDLWDAEDHAFGQSTHLDFESTLSLNETQKLRFIASSGEIVAPVFKTPTRLDQQTLRGVRQLTAASAAILDHKISTTPVSIPEELLPLSKGKYSEGAKKEILVNAFERNGVARSLCIEYYGCICSVCKFDFGKNYGKIGDGFIHVHHIEPLNLIRKKYKVDPIRDLRPVCPNCHAMLHTKNPPMSINALRSIVSRYRRKTNPNAE